MGTGLGGSRCSRAGLGGVLGHHGEGLPVEEGLTPEEGKQCSAHTVYRGSGQLFTSTGELVRRWTQYLEDLLNPYVMSSAEGAEKGDSEVNLSITLAEVTEVVGQLLGGKVWLWLRSLDVQGLSRLTVPLDWQTSGGF